MPVTKTTLVTCLLIIFSTLTACQSNNDTKGSNIPQTPQTSSTSVNPPKITRFGFTPSTIREGESTTLTWETTNATSITISPDIGTVESKGTRTLTPNKNLDYMLIASNAAGHITSSLRLTVEPRIEVKPADNWVYYPNDEVVWKINLERLAGAGTGAMCYIGCEITNKSTSKTMIELSIKGVLAAEKILPGEKILISGLQIPCLPEKSELKWKWQTN